MMKQRIDLVLGDITAIEADAIVNAANNTLLGGGGVDGAIHRAAGKELLEECRGLNGCETGDVKVTKGYNLGAKYVFHTVGPIWYGGYKNEIELLVSCYQKSLEKAKEYKIGTIAFPGISTGVYRFPKETAAKIALSQTKRFLEKHSYPKKVVFVAFDEENYKIYSNLLNTKDE